MQERKQKLIIRNKYAASRVESGSEITLGPKLIDISEQHSIYKVLFHDSTL